MNYSDSEDNDSFVPMNEREDNDSFVPMNEREDNDSFVSMNEREDNDSNDQMNEYFESQIERAIQASLQQYQVDMDRQSPKICFQYMVKPMSCLDEINKHIYESINQTSDKILLPLELLNTIYPGRYDNLSGNIEEIIIFEINIVGLSKKTYGTAYQYIDSDCIYLPDGMFRYLNADYDSICNFNLVNNVKKGKEVLLKPQNKEFINIRNQQELLFEEFNNQFRILYINQPITIYSKEIGKNIDFIVDTIIPEDEAIDEVVDTEFVDNGYPDNDDYLELIKIYDVDLIVNFELPDNIVDELKREEEEKKRAKLMQEASMKNAQRAHTNLQNIQQESGFVAFSEKGNSLLGNNTNNLNTKNNIFTPGSQLNSKLDNQLNSQLDNQEDNTQNTNIVNTKGENSKIDINKLREQRLKFFRS